MIWTIPRGRTPFFTRWHGALSGATSATPFDGATPGDSEPSTAGKAQKLEAREAAFEQFFHAHEATILGYLWRITGDEQASHDIAQMDRIRRPSMPMRPMPPVCPVTIHDAGMRQISRQQFCG